LPGNELDVNELSLMAKSKTLSTGPMRVQPTEQGSIVPMLPLMPSVGEGTKTQAPLRKKHLTRTEAVRAAKARITRQSSLRKQRDAQKERLNR